MTQQIPRVDIYDPKTLAVMDQTLSAIWKVLRADDPPATTAKTASCALLSGES
jgi:hypothetical protein